MQQETLLVLVVLNLVVLGVGTIVNLVITVYNHRLISQIKDLMEYAVRNLHS
jgi:cbb3-type cytochrome oxidase cytochrome c subunit